MTISKEMEGRIMEDSKRMPLNIQLFAEKKEDWINKKEKLEKNTNKNYEDISKEMFKTATPNSHKVVDAQELTINNKMYKFNNKNMIFKYTNHEKEIADLIEKELGGEIEMRPEFINELSGNRSADYNWKKEKWDLKEINSYGKRTIDTAIKSIKRQSNNIILEIKNDNYTLEEIENLIEKNYKDKKREYLDKVMIIKNETILKILKRK